MQLQFHVSLTWVNSQPSALTIHLNEPHIQDLAAPIKVLKFLDKQILQVRLEKSFDTPRFVLPFPGPSRPWKPKWKRPLLEPAFFSQTFCSFGGRKDRICQERISKHREIPKFIKPSSLQGHKDVCWSEVLSKLRHEGGWCTREEGGAVSIEIKLYQSSWPKKKEYSNNRVFLSRNSVSAESCPAEIWRS